MVTETIFSGKTVVIPMDEVSYIERDTRPEYKGNITVIFKHSKWDELYNLQPSVYLARDEATEFLHSWCRYRSELATS